jgi:hypothetical protein
MSASVTFLCSHFVDICLSSATTWQRTPGAARRRQLRRNRHTQNLLQEWPHVPREKKSEKGNEAESFKHMKIKYPTHMKMAMLAETCSQTVKTNTIKLHADGNITCNTLWTIQCSRMLKYNITDLRHNTLQVQAALEDAFLFNHIFTLPVAMLIVRQPFVQIVPWMLPMLLPNWVSKWAFYNFKQCH